jgi:hypothetical protein
MGTTSSLRLSFYRHLTHSLTHSLTPWCRILFEKLIVTQLIKKYLAFFMIHHRVHKSPLLGPILSQLNPVRPIHPYLPKVRLNVILPPTPRFSQWSLTFGPPNQNPVNTSPLSHACHMSRPPHPPWFNHPNNIRLRIQAVKFIDIYILKMMTLKHSTDEVGTGSKMTNPWK